MLDLKFNSGKGALCCPRCRRIIAYGFEHENKQYTCSNCGREVDVARQNTADPSVYYYVERAYWKEQ